MKEITSQSVAGNYSATAHDGTTMTEVTPTAVVTVVLVILQLRIPKH